MRVDARAREAQRAGVEQWIVRYAFERRGRSHAGRSRPLPWIAAARHAPRGPIELLVDDAEPPRSLVSGLDV